MYLLLFMYNWYSVVTIPTFYSKGRGAARCPVNLSDLIWGPFPLRGWGGSVSPKSFPLDISLITADSFPLTAHSLFPNLGRFFLIFPHSLPPLVEVFNLTHSLIIDVRYSLLMCIVTFVWIVGGGGKFTTDRNEIRPFVNI